MKNHRAGMTLLETVLAATIGAALLVPMMSMLAASTASHRRSEVATAMRHQAEQSIDAIRASVARPADFTRIAAGGFPPGLSNDQTSTVLPGEWVRQTISIRSADSRRDLLDVQLTLVHERSGLNKTTNPLRVITQIARPW